MAPCALENSRLQQHPAGTAETDVQSRGHASVRRACTQKQHRSMIAQSMHGAGAGRLALGNQESPQRGGRGWMYPT